jgi:hypothetical protein
LLSYARKEEKQLAKLETEKQLFPLWLSNFVVAKLKGDEVNIDFEEFVNECLKPGKPQPKNAKRTAEDIKAEFMPIIKADKNREEG